MTKYEFCWTISPQPHRRLAWKEKNDGFDVELFGDRIYIRTDFTKVSEDNLKGRGEPIVASTVRALGFRLGQQLTPSFGHVKRTRSTSEPTDIGLELGDKGPEMRDAVDWTIYKNHSCDAVIVLDSKNLEASEVFSLAERDRQSAPLQRMLEYIAAFRADPEKKLAPLYDILQVIEVDFGRREMAAETLGIPPADLKELGRIANDPSILTGRHPGKSPDPQQPITSQQLARCVEVAEAIIHNYAARVSV